MYGHPNKETFQKATQEQLSDPNKIRGFFGNYAFLSNFHSCSVEYEGVIYPSSENAYQAAKFAPEDRKPFIYCKPGQSKRLGNVTRMTPEQVEVWNQKSLRVMYTILKDKFARHQDLGEALSATGDKNLEETNWWKDTFWGVCDGTGRNMLGKTLMAVRKLLQLKPSQDQGAKESS